MLGVDQFAEYVSTYLADILINAVSSIILFAVVYILIHLVVRWLDLIARLPILYGLNHIAGAVLGLIQGLSVSLDWLFFGGNLFRHTFGNDIGGTDQRKYLAAVFISVQSD